MIPILEIEDQYGHETALLLICIRCHFITAEYDEIANYINTKPIDWNYFKKQASYHRIRPIAYRSLLKCGIVFKGIEDFKAELQQYTLRNWQLAFETERVLNIFENKCIKATPYKGTMFSKQFYGDLVSRTSSDIDLLIDWEDLRPCIEILKEEGYIPEWPLENFYTWNNILKNSENEYNMDLYKNGERMFHIELHWDISSKQIAISKKTTEILEYKKENTILLNRTVPCLTNESHFITMLVHHASKDTLRFLRNLVDILQAAQQIQETEWAIISSKLTTIKHQQSYEMSRTLIKSLIGKTIPALTNKKNSNDNILFFKQDLLKSGKRYEQNSQAKYIFSGFYKRALITDNLFSKFKQWIGFAKIIIHPNINDYKLFPINRKWFFLYYFSKPFRLLKKYIKRTEIGIF